MHGKVLFRLGHHKGGARGLKLKPKNKKKVSKEATGNDKNNNATIPEMNEDMASIIDQPAYETPSIFKIKLAEYKEQNHSVVSPF